MSESEIDNMSEREINRVKYWVCCPLCDNDKCVRGSAQCEAEQWAREKIAKNTQMI